MASNKRSKAGIWLIIGVIILVILLLYWQDVAFLVGDTDVAADFIQLTPIANMLI